MALTLQECIQKVKQAYPGMEPYAYTEFQNGYIFNLILPGQNPERAHADFHYVDPNTGEVSGAFPTIKILSNREFREAWQKAKKVSEAGSDGGEVEHAGMQRRFFADAQNDMKGVRDDTCRYRIRRSKPPNGGSSGFFNSGVTTFDALAHHGIKGQKWGEMHGPPYPLDSKTHNAVIKGKASGGNLKSGVMNEVVAPLALAVADVAAFIGVRHLVQKAVRRVQQNKRTADSKALSKDLLSDISDDRDFSNENPPKAIQGSHSPEQDMAAVNPKYFNHEVPGTSSNCVLCSFTYDLRRRGYDVTAKASAVGNDPDTLVKDLYEGARTERIRKGSFEDLYREAVKKYPEGSRGVIGVEGYMGGGHEMAFEVTNGQFVVRCAQSQEVLTPKRLSELGFNPRSSELIRTDHLKVKMGGLSKVCNELKPDWKKMVKAEANTRTSTKVNKPRKAMTRQQKMKSLEKQWKEQHPDIPLTAENKKIMDNWVSENMWSLQDEGEILIHEDGKDVKPMALQPRHIAAGLPKNTLAHYGVKGQKWGVRQYQNPDGTLTAAGKVHYSKSSEGSEKDSKKKTGLNKKGDPVQYESGSSKWKPEEASKLTDEELNKRNSRLQRERQYKDMTTPQWKKELSQTVKDAAKKIFIGSAATALTVVMAKKYKTILSKGSELLHKWAGRPLPHQITMDELMKKRG